MGKEMNLLVPILPGKSEAWRRFLQELEGSRTAQFTHWCQALGVEIQKIQLHDALGCALVLLTIQVQHPIEVARNLAQQESLFNDWLLTHVQQLHGLDLTRLKLK